LSAGSLTLPSGVYFDGNNLTIAVWVYALSSNTRVVDCASTYNSFAASVILQFNPYPYFTVTNGASSLSDAANVQGIGLASNAVPLNAWSHLAATVSDSSISVWLNAARQATGSISITVPSVSRTSCYFGRANSGSVSSANLIFDDLMFFNTGLSQAQLVTVATFYSTASRSFRGCFNDYSEHDLRFWVGIFNPNGHIYCTTICKSLGYKYAGLQFRLVHSFACHYNDHEWIKRSFSYDHISDVKYVMFV
jgi:hypothetical protein